VTHIERGPGDPFGLVPRPREGNALLVAFRPVRLHLWFFLLRFLCLFAAIGVRLAFATLRLCVRFFLCLFAAIPPPEKRAHIVRVVRAEP
jgi:hypothetical protein